MTDYFDKDVMRSVRWMGNSKKNILSFPPEVRKIIGDELQLIQFGGMPKDAKPFKGLGSGIIELAIRYDKDAYRTVLAIQLGNCIYVLHVFQKKSKTGIKTPQEDINLIRKRLNEAKQLAQEN